MVHVKPQGATSADAKLGKAELKPISQLKVSDEVLAQAEWEEIGSQTGQDGRLSYQPIEDIFTSNKEQTLVYLTLDNGEKLTATDGHPFKTTDGWRDAIVLKAGSKLLLKSNGESTERTATVVSTSTEQTTVPVYNLEVATAHTFFVGEDGELVHNCKNFAGKQNKNQRLRDLVNDDKVSSADRGWIQQELNEVAAGKKKHLRNPPGKDLAHERGRENAKGYGYEHANLQNRADHRAQHKLDNQGRANKERP